MEETPMKLHTVLIRFVLMLLFFSTTVKAETQWELIETLEDPIPFQDIHFFDMNNGWAVDSKQVVYKTEDGGRNWQKQYDPQSSLAMRMRLYFPSRERGWIMPAHWGTYSMSHYTTDGGVTWQRNNEVLRLLDRDLTFLNDHESWLVQYDFKKRKGRVLHTDDGGENWTIRHRMDVGLEFLNVIFFATAQEGWIAGKDATIFHSSSGGRNWEDVSRRIQRLVNDPLAADLTDIFFTDADRGWIVGHAGTILHTRNGGQNWELVRPRGVRNLSEVRWQDIEFVDDKTGWIVGGVRAGTNVILRTRDGGKTWDVTEHRTPLLGMSFISAQVGWIAGAGNTLLFTQDGGETWDSLRQVNLDYTDISFYAPKQGYVVGSSNLFDIQTSVGATDLRHTTDVGNWSPPIEIDVPLRHVEFITERIGWGVSYYPFWQFFQTVNSVRQWKRVRPERLYAFDFGDASHGFAGGRGFGIRTEDAKRWEVIKLPNVWTSAVFMLDDKQIWLVGKIENDKKGIILYSEDGGVTWEQQFQSNVDASFRDVTFVDKNHGWVVTFGGSIYRTSNGGKNWARRALTIYATRALMLSPTEGFLVGGGRNGRGAILHTIDGGQSFEEMKVDTPNWLYAIAYDGDNRLVVGGVNRTLLEYVDDDLKKYADAFALNPKALHLTTWGEQKFQILPIYPNPANPEVWIPYRLPQAAKVILQVTDIHGQLVREIHFGRQRAGMYDTKEKAAYWDGKTNSGETVSSGIYFCTIQAGDQMATRKAVIVK